MYVHCMYTTYIYIYIIRSGLLRNRDFWFKTKNRSERQCYMAKKSAQELIPLKKQHIKTLRKHL